MLSSVQPVDPPPLSSYLTPFWLRLQAERPRRIERRRIFEIWSETMPAHVASLASPESILDALLELKKRGLVSLPPKKATSEWDHAFKRPFPRRVTVRAEKTEKTEPELGIVWHPKLDALVASNLRGRRRERALAINDWLKSGDDQRPSVPYRERSWDIFGDEEILERECDDREAGIVFAFGPLTFEDLCCHAPDSPLPACDSGTPDGRPLLVVANLHTWETISKWNLERGVYASVVWGAGNGAPGSAAFLTRKAAGAPVHYLCDITERSLVILSSLADKMERRGSGQVVFAAWAARAMLTKAGMAGERNQPLRDLDLPRWASGIDLDVACRMIEVVKDGRRIPTESIGEAECRSMFGRG